MAETNHQVFKPETTIRIQIGALCERLLLNEQDEFRDLRIDDSFFYPISKLLTFFKFMKI